MSVMISWLKLVHVISISQLGLSAKDRNRCSGPIM